jgi:hypothetical protein
VQEAQWTKKINNYIYKVEKRGNDEKARSEEQQEWAKRKEKRAP